MNNVGITIAFDNTGYVSVSTAQDINGRLTLRLVGPPKALQEYMETIADWSFELIKEELRREQPSSND